MLRSAPGTSRFRSHETIPHRTGLHGAVKDRKVKSRFHHTSRHRITISIANMVPNEVKTDSVQSSSNTCKNYLLKIYSQHAVNS